MALKGRTTDTAANQRAADVFKRIDKDFGKLNKTTETIAFRVPKGEKNRLRLLFARQGLTLTQGAKKALYDYAQTLEK